MAALNRLVLVAMLALGALLGTLDRTGAQTPVTASAGHLVVADPAAEIVVVHQLPGLEIVAEFPGIAMNDHAGFLALPDGRLLLVDGKANALIAIRLDDPAGPAIDGIVPVPAGVSHVAVDPGLAFAAVGSSDPNRPLTIVDLDSYTSRSLDVEAGEVGLMLGGDPLMLFHRNDALAQVEAYPVDGFRTGATTPTGVVPIGAYGHGEGISHELGMLAMATEDGLDLVRFEGTRLTYVGTLPWASDGREGGRAFFVRIAPDGRHLVSYIADRGTAETPWETWTNDLYLADLAEQTVKRVELGPGLVFRFALADGIALFVTMHPEGDAAHIVDVDPASGSYGTITARIPLAPLANAAGPGESPWEAESRIAAITPDGTTGFVTHGGEGMISVIDIASGAVSGTFRTATPLSGGGYLIAIQPGMPFADTVAR